MKKRYYYRSAITGRFVSEEYAEANPDTTVRHERIEKASCLSIKDRMDALQYAADRSLGILPLG